MRSCVGSSISLLPAGWGCVGLPGRLRVCAAATATARQKADTKASSLMVDEAPTRMETLLPYGLSSRTEVALMSSDSALRPVRVSASSSFRLPGVTFGLRASECWPAGLERAYAELRRLVHPSKPTPGLPGTPETLIPTPAMSLGALTMCVSSLIINGSRLKPRNHLRNLRVVIRGSAVSRIRRSGAEGQKKPSQGRVVVVGCGATRSAASLPARANRSRRFESGMVLPGSTWHWAFPQRRSTFEALPAMQSR